MTTIKNMLCIGLCALLPLLASAGDAQFSVAPNTDALPPLMPYPRVLTLHPAAGEFILNGDSALCFRSAPGARLQAAAARFHLRTERQTGISLDAAVRCNKPRALNNISAIELALTSTAAHSIPTTLGELTRAREAYQLEINPQKIILSAAFEEGILRGLHTLSQLLGTHRRDAIFLHPMTINDQPHFRWRGLMLDTARHFFSVDTIKRQLDGMAAAKLNVFHWHLTDDQGWRLESSTYPRLHQTAPGGKFYTREQVRDIVGYARARGIVVVPEIDMPGHASAIAAAYPELMSAPGPYTPEDRWGVHKPLLNPANPAVYTFAEKVLEEVAALFPFEYVHIGGDEVDPEHWETNPDIQRFMQAQQLQDSRALHNYFNGRLAEILAGLNRRMIGWDEILHPGLAPGAAVQSWRGPDALAEIARAGHYGLLSTGFYLDQPQYASYHYRNTIIPDAADFAEVQAGEQWQTWQFSAPRKRGSPVSGTFTLVESREGELRGAMVFAGKAPQPLHRIERTGPYIHFSLDTWMGPLRARLRLQNKTLSGEFVVGNTPYHPVGERVGGGQMENATPEFSNTQRRLTDAQETNILGGEAALWAEMVDEHTIDLRLWPRAFAVAERLWSGSDLRDEDFLYRRLAVIDQWAETALGLQHHSQQAAALQQLFPKNLQQQALVFSAVLEPAHYYHRHHEKSVHETYSRRDPLNRFADSLPAESIALRELRQLAEYPPESPMSEFITEPLHDGLLHLWRAGVAARSLRQHTKSLPADILKLTELVDLQMELGFLITTRFVDRQTFRPVEEATIRAQISSLKGMHGEVVLPAAYVLERLMDRLQYSETGVNNNTDKQHD